jgi:exonuclease VII small subunit
MPGSMDALPEARQHDDIMTHTADQLNRSMERVRQARQLLFDASDRLTRTRQDVEKDARIERVRRAGALLQVASQHLNQTRQQLEDDQRQDAADPATDDASMNAVDTP